MEAIILYLQIIDGQMDGSMGGQESLMSLVHKQIQIDLQRPRHWGDVHVLQRMTLLSNKAKPKSPG